MGGALDADRAVVAAGTAVVVLAPPATCVEEGQGELHSWSFIYDTHGAGAAPSLDDYAIPAWTPPGASASRCRVAWVQLLTWCSRRPPQRSCLQVHGCRPTRTLHPHTLTPTTTGRSRASCTPPHLRCSTHRITSY
jgi:hypothetical protein